MSPSSIRGTNEPKIGECWPFNVQHSPHLIHVRRQFQLSNPLPTVKKWREVNDTSKSLRCPQLKEITICKKGIDKNLKG